jgi:hypothetical protein
MAKLYCILARKAEFGVIFRRGPAKQVRLIGWNLKTHTFEPGQWFKGRIYERKSDLSPNGKKLVYFGAKWRWGSELPTYIAISTPPFLTAQVLWATIGTYNDLSMFETDNMLALATYSSDSSIKPADGFDVPRPLIVRRKPWPGHFHILQDHDRLIRDGWSVHSGDSIYRAKSEPPPIVYRKPVSGGTRTACLELSALGDAKVFYAVRIDDNALIDLKADWAEARGEDVFFSQGGKLFRTRFARSGKKVVCEPYTLLADFSDMKFEPIEAPKWAKAW